MAMLTNQIVEKPKHYGLAQWVMKLIIDDMPNANLDPKEIKRWQLITIGDESILLATLNINLVNPGRYESATHRIQTVVRSRVPHAKAAWVNSTGWRWAIRISRVQPLAKMLPFPGVTAGKILIGKQRNGTTVQFGWSTFDQHMIIAGMTRSGKSSFARLVVYQAMAAGAQVMIADMKERTFLAFEKHPALVRAIAGTPQQADELINHVAGEIEHRKRLFNELPGLHEKLSEYNQAAIRAGKPTLPRLLVILDEYQAAMSALGGVRGKFATRVWDIVRIGLAYGVNVVLSTQDVGRDDLGGLRDQFGMIVCFRTKNPDTARNLHVRPAATIPDGIPGRAYCDPFGWVQSFHLGKEALLEGVPGEAVTADEIKLFEAASANEWRVTRALIQDALGVTERAARAVQESLAQRGWLVKDGQSQNAFCVSDRWKMTVGHDFTGVGRVGRVGRWTQSTPESGQEEQS